MEYIFFGWVFFVKDINIYFVLLNICIIVIGVDLNLILFIYEFYFCKMIV